MVWGALLGLAGYGAQAYGSDQKTQAMKNAQYAYNQWLQRGQKTQSHADRQLQAYLKQIAGAYDQDVSGLVDQFAPADRMSAFREGQQNSQNGVEQVLSLINQQNPTYAQGATGLFANAQTAAADRATAATQPAIGAATMAGALQGMSDRDHRASFDFSDKASDYSSKITDAMRLYELGNATRNQALQRAALQHQQDLSQAQLAGNGAMLAGGLLQAGGTAVQAYQNNQQPNYGSYNSQTGYSNLSTY